MGTLDYFAYISRNKVDQLYEQLDPEAHFEITESQLRETSVRADARTDWGIPHIVSLFRVGGTYGRKGVIQREAKVKQTYLEKLRVVLAALAEHAPIQPLEDLLRNGVPPPVYCHFEDRFRVTEPVSNPRVDDVITLGSASSGVLLDCSLRNFSEGPMPDGTFLLHSANARFFKGELWLPITTVFLVLDISQDRVVGSPLFLKLVLGDHDRGPPPGLTAL